MSLGEEYRLDYKKYHVKGEKVLKKGENLKMDKLKIEESKLFNDLKHTLEIYNLDEMDSGVEINEAQSEINDLSKKFRHVHCELQNKLSNYDETYPDYDKTINSVTEYIKKARKRVVALKQESEIAQLEVAVELLLKKISQLNVL